MATIEDTTRHELFKMSSYTSLR